MVLASAQLFQLKFGAEAEISSLGGNDRMYRLEATPLDAHVTRQLQEKTGAKVLGAFGEGATAVSQLNTNSEQVGKNSESGPKDELPMGVEAPQNYRSPDREQGKAADDHRAPPGACSMEEDALYAATKKAKRSAPPALTENMDKSVSGDAQSREGFVEAAQGGSNVRAEYRRARDEDRGSNPRQSEPYLDTSTFALTGDSAHNQAMVHWSGHNSSVSSTNNTSHIIKLTPTHLLHNPDYENAPNKVSSLNSFLPFNWMCRVFTHRCHRAQQRGPFQQGDLFVPV